jgi:energy-coupling factor transporter transmembrane protein EcfT
MLEPLMKPTHRKREPIDRATWIAFALLAAIVCCIVLLTMITGGF